MEWPISTDLVERDIRRARLALLDDVPGVLYSKLWNLRRAREGEHKQPLSSSLVGDGGRMARPCRRWIRPSYPRAPDDLREGAKSRQEARSREEPGADMIPIWPQRAA